MAQDKDEKTEKPTGRRKDEAKKKGDVPRSKDLNASVGLFFTIFFFSLFTSYMGKTMLAVYNKYFRMAGDFHLTQNSFMKIYEDSFWVFVKLCSPFFIMLIAVAFLMEILQGGGIQIVTDRFKIKWEKVWIVSQIPSGLKKVVGSLEALFDLFKSIVKVVIIGVIGYYTVMYDAEEIIMLPTLGLTEILELMGWVFLKLAMNITLFLLILSLFDYLWQRYRYIEKLKMSKQDIKDEYKQLEGDPKVKGKQKQIQFERAMQRMMAEVPEADVVITNPTHYAVALKYEFKKMHSPKLVAKGKDLSAQRIKDVAKENNVPVVENPPVARAVFSSVEIGDFIPGDLFKPIAEILAYIYKLKGKNLG